MSVSELYHIVSRGPLHYTVAFNAAHAVYRAHFPGNPLTPGACQISIAEHLLGDALHTPVRFAVVHSLKFLAPLTPDLQPSFTFELREGNRCNITVQDQLKAYAKMSVTYMCADSHL